MTPLKRREFTQLAAASLTSTIVTDLSSKALAQKSQEVLYKAKLLKTSNDLNREDQTPPIELSAADVKTGKVVSRINVPAQFVDNPLSVPKKFRAFFTDEADRITKLTALGDGNLVMSTVSIKRNGYFNRLLYTVGGAKTSQFRAKKVLDLKTSNQTIESLLSLPKNLLLCIVGIEGIPPFSFRIIDSRNGKIISGDELNLPPLPPSNRFANLCQDPKGNIFATEISSEGMPILISMNLEDKAVVTGKVKIKRLNPLNFEGRPLLNDVRDLNFSASGQLYAVAGDKSGKKTRLFTVDVKSGKMGLVNDDFGTEKFAFSV
ncbi:MAG: hypothetical protein RMZ41_000745 [Nostoc sp. DedVER02]|uniref:hypothetical protein n=1 Tax=unclassified Nostoc TaxID=2593658 RepID=UPI002AD23C06|nr:MULTISPECIES: hypothetical protein [unclassified Nostoc]MDZ7988021.1 hypothetical protein [Nostoc sp. DedVER02]MDZ8114946.1 hypothetical protein [Nostoc sp. DedVER01b]